MKMKGKNIKLLLITALFFSAEVSQAVTLGFDNITQSGNVVGVDLVISGLGNGSTPSIGAYDLDIHFDDSHLAYSNTVFGDPILGNQLDVFNLGDNDFAAVPKSSGIINLYELSFDLPIDLNNFQVDSFTLAAITFDILIAGTSQLDIFANALSDEDDGPLTPSSSLRLL